MYEKREVSQHLENNFKEKESESKKEIYKNESNIQKEKKRVKREEIVWIKDFFWKRKRKKEFKRDKLNGGVELEPKAGFSINKIVLLMEYFVPCVHFGMVHDFVSNNLRRHLVAFSGYR